MRYGRLPSKYRGVYSELLRMVAETHESEARKLIAFWPRRGRAYPPKGGLMIVGRSLNGGSVRKWVPQEIAFEQERLKVLNELIERFEGSATCPMSWVIDESGNDRRYNTNHSAFWRVSKRLHNRLIGTSTAWSSDICWSNLYKVSPAERGNPSPRLRRTQFEHCANLLSIEITTWKPRVVVILAGRDWFDPFESRLGLRMHNIPRSSLVEKQGMLGGSRLILCKHPERKSESKFLSEFERLL